MIIEYFCLFVWHVVNHNTLYVHLLLFFRPCHMTCGILVPQPRNKPMPVTVKVQSPNQWTIHTIPHIVANNRISYFYGWVTSYTHTHTHTCIFSSVQLFAISWTLACQVPLSMEFPRQEHWNRLPFPTPEDLPDQRSNFHLHWQADVLPLRATWETYVWICIFHIFLLLPYILLLKATKFDFIPGLL